MGATQAPVIFSFVFIFLIRDSFLTRTLSLTSVIINQQDNLYGVWVYLGRFYFSTSCTTCGVTLINKVFDF